MTVKSASRSAGSARRAAASAPRQPHALEGVLDRIEDSAGPESTRVADLAATLGHASFAPLLLLPALIVVSPLSGIPGMSTICGLSIALIALQMLLGRRHIWLPAWLLRREVTSARLQTAIDWLRRPSHFIDRLTANRLTLFVMPPADRLLLLACALAGLSMPLLELVPFTSSILAAAVCLMALGLLVHDGLVALGGLLCVGGAVGLVAWMLASHL